MFSNVPLLCHMKCEIFEPSVRRKGWEPQVKCREIDLIGLFANFSRTRSYKLAVTWCIRSKLWAELLLSVLLCNTVTHSKILPQMLMFLSPCLETMCGHRSLFHWCRNLYSDWSGLCSNHRYRSLTLRRTPVFVELTSCLPCRCSSFAFSFWCCVGGY